MQSLTPGLARPFGKLVSFVAVAAITLGLASGLVSSASAANNGDITVTGSIAPTITLVLSETSVGFGSLTPDYTGTFASGVTGIYAADESGTLYTYGVSGDVQVRSNKVWNGSIVASAFSGPDGFVVGDLSVVGTTWSGSLGSELDFEGPKGNNSYHHDYSAQVDWVDDTGTFGTTITYTVTNA